MNTLQNVAVGQMQAMDGRLQNEGIQSRGRVPGTIDLPGGARQAPKQQSRQEAAMERQSLEDTIKEMQSLSDLLDRRIRFNVNRDLGKVIISIVDPSTDKVIKEIPSQDIQKLQARMKEQLGKMTDPSGILVDEQS
jgi:flagellar protein FlaG